MQADGVPAAALPTEDSDSEHSDAAPVPAATMPTADSESEPSGASAGPDTAMPKSETASRNNVGASQPGASSTSIHTTSKAPAMPASPAHSQHTADALARLDEYDALAQRVLRVTVLEPRTAVSRLAQHIAAMAEHIEELEGKRPVGKASAKTKGSASILADADRELQLMEQLIKQQDDYIAKLESHSH